MVIWPKSTIWPKPTIKINKINDRCSSRQAAKWRNRSHGLKMVQTVTATVAWCQFKWMAKVQDREIDYNSAGVKAGSPLSWLEGNTSDFLVTLDHTDFNFQRKATALVQASSRECFRECGGSGIYMEVAIGRSKFKNLKQLKIITNSRKWNKNSLPIPIFNSTLPQVLGQPWNNGNFKNQTIWSLQ